MPFVDKVKRFLGLCEEDIEECGGSMYLPTYSLLTYRIVSTAAYLGCMILMIADKSRTTFVLFWRLQVPSQYFSMEFWSVLLGLISFSLLATVSSFHYRSTARSDVLAHIAGPLHYASATLALFSAVAASIHLRESVLWTSYRMTIYSVPLLVVVLDILLGSRLHFRFRATCIPLTTIQIHNTFVLAYMRVHEPDKLWSEQAVMLGLLGIGWQLLSAACAVTIAMCSRVTLLFGKKELDEVRGNYGPSDEEGNLEDTSEQE